MALPALSSVIGSLKGMPWSELSTRRLLTLDWLEGRRLLEHKDDTLAVRNRLGTAMFTAWWFPFSRFGVIHGDPHLGNYQVRPDATVNLLDYGAIRVFRPHFVRGVIDLYEAVRDGDDDKAHHAYESWGFTNLSREKMQVLNMWANFLYEPLIQDRVRRIQETNDPQYGREIAERVHAGLKRTGGVRPPREFVLMDRSAIGLGGVFLRLGARLNWSRLFRDLIADFDEAALARRQAAALVEAGVPSPL